MPMPNIDSVCGYFNKLLKLLLTNSNQTTWVKQASKQDTSKWTLLFLCGIDLTKVAPANTLRMPLYALVYTIHRPHSIEFRGYCCCPIKKKMKITKIRTKKCDKNLEYNSNLNINEHSQRLCSHFCCCHYRFQHCALIGSERTQTPSADSANSTPSTFMNYIGNSRFNISFSSEQKVFAQIEAHCRCDFILITFRASNQTSSTTLHRTSRHGMAVELKWNKRHPFHIGHTVERKAISGLMLYGAMNLEIRKCLLWAPW